MTAYLPFIVPVLTFALGAGLTLLLKRQDRNVSAVSIYAKDLSDCATEWYNQIYEIDQSVRRGNSDKQIAEKLDFYSRNRVILPKFLRAMEVLKRRPEAKELVSEADEMLKVLIGHHVVPEPVKEVTDPRFRRIRVERRIAYSTMPISKLGAPPVVLQGAPLARALLETFARETAESLCKMLPTLDKHVQLINVEAGKIL